MDSHTLTPRGRRPTVGRSQTAHADLYAPARHHLFRADTATSNAPKKHTRDFIHSYTNLHRHHDEKNNTLPTPALLKPAAVFEQNKTPSSRDSMAASSDSVPASTRNVGRVRPAELAEERRRGEERDDELRSSLNELSELAHASTRRLDNIYYNLLEKVGTIRATIGSLQELAEASRKLHSNFQEEVGGLETDIQSQIDAYGSFKGQQSRVEDMEARVRAARSRAEALSGRLETARTRVETWAHREKEWQEKTSKRLRFSLGVLIAFGVIIVALLFIRQLRRSSIQSQLDGGALKRLLENTSLPAFAASDLAQIMSSRTASSGASLSSLQNTALPSDSRLAGFDEL